MDKELRQLKDIYKKENASKFTKDHRDHIYQRISERKQPSPKMFHPFRIALTLVATMIVGFLLLTNLNETQQGNPLPTEPSFEGYVIEVINGQALVTNSNGEKAIKYTDVPNDIKVGQKIKTWHKTVSDSNPPKARLKKFEVINNRKVNGSNLTVAEALYIAIQRKILDGNPSPLDSLLFVNSVQYDSGEQQWEVGIKYQSGAIGYIPVNDLINETDKPNDINNDYVFNYDDYGERFEELEEKVIHSLNGGWSILNSLARQDLRNRTNKEVTQNDFSNKLNGVAINSEGTVTIDFQPFHAGLATAQSGELYDEIRRLAFSFDKVQKVYLQFNGSREAVAGWNQSGRVAPITRDRDFNTEHEIFKVIQNYKYTFNYLFKNNYNQKLEFKSIEEVKNYFTRYMSKELSHNQSKIYIEERNDGIYLLKTKLPTLIDLSKEYQIQQVDSYTYLVKQKINDDQLGRIEVRFFIKHNDYKWFVDSVETKQLNK